MIDETTTTELIRKMPEILVALGMVISAVGSIVAAILSYRARQQSKENAAGIVNIEHAVNGHTDKLVALTEKSSYAEGLLAGQPQNTEIKLPDIVKVEIVDEEKK